jgi:hypothetical protein
MHLEPGNLGSLIQNPAVVHTAAGIGASLPVECVFATAHSLPAIRVLYDEQSSLFL